MMCDIAVRIWPADLALGNRRYQSEARFDSSIYHIQYHHNKPQPSLSSSMSAFVSAQSAARIWKARRGRTCARRVPRMGDGATRSADTPRTQRMRSFLREAAALGTLRFVAVSRGAVLETIGRLDYATSTFHAPGRGHFVSVAAPDRLFECHINVDQVHAVSLSQERAKVGHHAVYVMRFLDERDLPLLSCMLMWHPSHGPAHYLADAVQRFTQLRERHNGRFTV